MNSSVKILWRNIHIFVLVLMTGIFPSVARAAEPDPAEIISSLVDPVKLSKLKPGTRAANNRFYKIMYWTYVAEKNGHKSNEVFKSSYAHFKIPPYSNQFHVYAPKTEKINLEANFRLGKQYGIYTPDNLKLMRSGKSPVVQKGIFRGEKLHVDHILPCSKYPELENSMANLQWIPASINLQKSDKITNASLRRARDLAEESRWRN